jgi:hypothetical protein
VSPLVAQEVSGSGHPFSHFVIAAGIGIVAFLVVRVKERHDRRIQGRVGDALPSQHLLHALAIASVVSGAVHAAVGPAHFREATILGVFFAGTFLVQMAWAVLVVTRPSRAVLAAGAAANAAIVLVWLVSRTTGLPVGPEIWEPEAITALDAVTTALEVGIVAGSSWALLRATARRTTPLRAA